jgi:hypothetical protein
MTDLPEIKIEVSIKSPNTLRLKSKWRMESTGKKGLFIGKNGEHPVIYAHEEFELIKLENEE